MGRINRKLNFPLPAGADNGTPCSRFAVMYRVFAAESSAASDYENELMAAGWQLLWRRKSGENDFSAFSGHGERLSVSFIGAERLLRVIAAKEPPLAAPSPAPAGDALYPHVTLTQFATHTSYSKKVRGSASGMGYVIRLRDGRLIVIDGGFHFAPEFENDYPDFLALLRQLSAGEKPRVSLWVLTHAHIDHYGLLKQWKPEDADIAAFLATLPPEGVHDAACEDMITGIPQFTEKLLSAHTGDLYEFGDVTLEVYGTCEELAVTDREAICKDLNNQSLIFGIRVSDQQVLFTGDARYPALDRAWEISGERMRSTICQIPHHGRTVNGDDKTISAIAPKVALWPACRTQIDYDTSHMEGVNGWVFGSQSTVIDHLVANDGTVTLTLPYTLRGIAYRQDQGMDDNHGEGGKSI